MADVSIAADCAQSTCEQFRLRAEFPALAAAPDVAYLDSATTTPTPRAVIDTVTRALGARAASPGRGNYPWATRVSAEVSGVRASVAEFLGAGGSDEIAFTAGATAAMNAVALSWGMTTLADGDEILLCPDDHASIVRPWLNVRELLARAGITVRLVSYPLTVTGDVDEQAVLDLVSPRTRMLVAGHVHSLFGGLGYSSALNRRLDPAVLRCVDCSQSVGHLPVNVRMLGADFAIVAGHKMFAPPGVGVLYCAPRTHAALRPFLPGGAGADGADDVPRLLEGGTPNAAGILGLGTAIEFLDDIGVDRIAAHGAALTRRVVERLTGVPGIEVLGSGGGASGIVSLRVPGMRSTDVGFVLAAHDIYARAGDHCADTDDRDAVRLSVHAYTEVPEVDRACDVLIRLAEAAR